MPAPTNSAQLRLNRLPPVAPPVTERNRRNSSCAPDMERGNVGLARAPVPPVETRLAVVRIGPVIESWWTSIAASGDPAVRPFPPSATRNVIESMLVRLNGPLSWIQSLLARLPRCTPAPPSVFVAVLVPDWLTTCSTSWCFWRIWCWLMVFSGGTPPSAPLSVYSALITPNTLPPWDASSAAVGRDPLQPVWVTSS